jgi:cobalamin biosynthesis Mg chelatase CobN
VDSQTETNDDAPVSTPSPSDENKSTNNNSSSSTSSTSTSSSKAASNVASSDSVAVDAPLSSPAAVLPDAKDPQPSATQSTSEGSVMFGLGWLGATLVVLFGAIVTVLAITAIHLTHKKTAKL